MKTRIRKRSRSKRKIRSRILRAAARHLVGLGRPAYLRAKKAADGCGGRTAEGGDVAFLRRQALNGRGR